MADENGIGANEASTGASAPIQSVDRALQILELLTDSPSLGTSAIARKLGVHRSTASRLLTTLESHDVVEQVSDRGEYRLGLGLLRMAYPVSTRFDLARDSQVVCDALAEATQETSNVAILDEGYAVTITQSAGQRMVGVAGQWDSALRCDLYWKASLGLSVKPGFKSAEYRGARAIHRDPARPCGVSRGTQIVRQRWALRLEVGRV